MKHDFHTLRQCLLYAVVAVTGCLGMACRKEAGESSFGKYSFHLMVKDGSECLIQSDSVETGVIDPGRLGIRPIPARHFYDLVPRRGYYYYVDPKTSRFLKCMTRNGSFSEVGSVSLTGISLVENLTWFSEDSLLLIGYDTGNAVTRYARINTDRMSAEQGIVDIPSPSKPFNWISVGFVRLTDKKISIGYTYHFSTGPGRYTTSDTMYVDVLSFPGMKSLARYKDTRSAYPGGVNTKESYSFTDENGDFYFIACPGIIAGNHPGKPTAIFKIPAGEEKPDPGYFLNISASPIGNHAYGCWYIGNGKVIVRAERKDLYKGLSDHYKTPHFSFFLADLHSGTTSRLDLPLDKGSSRQCVLAEGGKVYITVNSDTDGCFVWIFDPATRSLQKGMQFTGSTDYILRMDKM